MRAGVWGGTPGSIDRETIGILEEVLSELPDENLPLRACVMARLAARLYWSDSHDRAVALSRAAVEVARRCGDAAALTSALWSKHVFLWGPENLEGETGCSLRDSTVVGGYRKFRLVFEGQRLKICALIELGEIHEVEAQVVAYSTVADHMGLQYGTVQKFRACLALLGGGFEEAEKQAGVALELGQRHQDPAALLFYGAEATLLRYEQGRLTELEPLLKSFTAQYLAHLDDFALWADSVLHGEWSARRSESGVRIFSI